MFKVSSFNIKCLGTNGIYQGDFGTEERVDSIKSFISEHLFDSDVIFLQEIVDVSLLKHMLPKNFKTLTYEHPFKKHQFIVVAYRFNTCKINIMEKVPESAINQTVSRPAIYINLTLLNNQQISQSYNLVGVHVKSGDKKEHLRDYQISTIIHYLKSKNLIKNLIVLGDFNVTSEEEKIRLDEKFKELNLVRAPLGKDTYQTKWESKEIDLCYHSSNFKNHKMTTFSVDDYGGIERFNTEISDHTPISFEILKR